MANTTTPSTLATATLGKGEQREAVDEAWIREIKMISYQVLMPVIVVLGVTINAFGLYLLRKPRMRALQCTMNLELLFGLNVAILLVNIGSITTTDGCELQSYAVALYFAHPCFTAFYAMRLFSHYVVVWLCCDRFLALWCFNLFRQMQQPRVMKLRLILTGLFCIGLQMKYFLDVEVLCMTVSDEGIVEVTNGTQLCEQGYWFIHNIYQEIEDGDTGRNVMMMVIIALGLVVPVVLVLVFSVGIVVGMVRRRIQSIAATTSTLQQAYSAIYITLALALVFFINIMLTVVYAIIYTENTKSCYASSRKEVFRAATHLLVLAEHLTLTLFLVLNQTFREELRTLLHTIKGSLCNALNCLTLTVCPSRRTRSATLNTRAVTVFHNILEGPQISPSRGETVHGAPSHN
ncbi:hypothetical protein E2C01_034741 [Portunus trituberculatus]|uniref:G-protein coupled receptors family 1 profile domain-containing protein n=1 Tax=Portunus trituberculatus TaxID=210409 RepID=A0A5B7F756_PORTR|nr:hypothetical protein [Portunus trituberculatus]